MQIPDGSRHQSRVTALRSSRALPTDAKTSTSSYKADIRRILRHGNTAHLLAERAAMSRYLINSNLLAAYLSNVQSAYRRSITTTRSHLTAPQSDLLTTPPPHTTHSHSHSKKPTSYQPPCRLSAPISRYQIGRRKTQIGRSRSSVIRPIALRRAGWRRCAAKRVSCSRSPSPSSLAARLELAWSARCGKEMRHSHPSQASTRPPGWPAHPAACCAAGPTRDALACVCAACVSCWPCVCWQLCECIWVRGCAAPFVSDVSREVRGFA
jgi:hypothetical protein